MYEWEPGCPVADVVDFKFGVTCADGPVSRWDRLLVHEKAHLLAHEFDTIAKEAKDLLAPRKVVNETNNPNLQPHDHGLPEDPDERVPASRQDPVR